MCGSSAGLPNTPQTTAKPHHRSRDKFDVRDSLTGFDEVSRTSAKATGARTIPSRGNYREAVDPLVDLLSIFFNPKQQPVNISLRTMLSTGNPAFYGASANASTCGAIRSDLHIQMLPPQPALALPILPDPDFLERPDIAAWIRNNCAEANSRVALVGPGGIGYTQRQSTSGFGIALTTPEKPSSPCSMRMRSDSAMRRYRSSGCPQALAAVSRRPIET